MKNHLLQPGSRRSGCQKAELRERVGCATLPFTETSSAEGGKSYEKVLEARSLMPRIVSSHSLFSGTVARSCSLRRTPAPTRKRWTVRTSSSESLDSGFASSFGTLTSSTAELSKKISFFCLRTEVPISFSL